MAIASVAITVLSVFIIVLSMLLGIRRGIRGTAVKITSVLVTFFIAFLIAKIISASISGGLDVPAFIKDLLPDELTELYDTSESFILIIKSSFASLVSPFLFVAAFFVVFLIMLIPEHIVKKHVLNNQKGDIISGVIASSVVGFVIVFALLLPVGGISRAAKTAKSNLISSGEVTEAYDEYVSPVTSNVFVSLTSVLTSPVYDSLSVIRVKDASTSVCDAVDVGTRLVSDVLPLAESEKDAVKEAECIEKFASDFEKTEILPSFAGDFLSNAAKEWKKGNAYLGLSLGGYDKSGKFGDVFDTIFDILASSDKDTVKSDISHTASLLSLFAEKGVLETPGGESDITKTLSSHGLVSGVVEKIYCYDRFRPIAVDFINIALDHAGETLEFDEQTKKDIRLDKNKLPVLSETEIKEESLRIEDAVIRIFDFASSLSGSDVLAADITSLGRALDDASDSLLLGDKVKLILRSALKSKSIQDMGFFSDKVIDKIDSGDISYEKTFGAAEKTLDLIKAVEDSSSGGKPIDKETAVSSINWLIENTDDSVTGIISSAMTPEFIKDFGLPEKNASKVSGMFTNYFEKLGNAGKMSENDVSAEADCISVVFSAASAESKDIIGGVIGSSDELVDAFMGSEIFSSSVVDAVYEGENPVIDPFGAGENIPDSEKSKIERSLKEYLVKNYGSASDKTEFTKKIIAAGSVFGIDFTGFVE